VVPEALRPYVGLERIEKLEKLEKLGKLEKGA
jgi:hypothetical protein